MPLGCFSENSNSLAFFKEKQIVQNVTYVQINTVGIDVSYEINNYNKEQIQIAHHV